MHPGPLPAGERVALRRAVSHALRHEPWVYELELDAEGWTSLPALVGALRDLPRWREVTAGHIGEVVAAPGKRRFERDANRIRALYGHSVPGRIVKVEGAPPWVVFHGTSPQAWEVIRVAGLVAMGRQYVHLFTDRTTAVEVGRRKAAHPGLLVVDAARRARGEGPVLGGQRAGVAGRRRPGRVSHPELSARATCPPAAGPRVGRAAPGRL